MQDMAPRPQTLGGVAADETVDLNQFLIAEAEIGLADGYQLLALLPPGPDPKGVIGVIGRSLAVAALRIHQHGIDYMRIALPLPPKALGTSRQIWRVTPFQHDPFDGVGIRAGRGGVSAGRRQFAPGRKGD